MATGVAAQGSGGGASRSGPAVEPEDDEPHIRQEREWSDAGRKIAACTRNEKMIEAKELELMSVIQANYSKIRNVESELRDLQLQLKMTSGPKKSVLELLRKKIEVQNGKVVAERQRVAKAKQLLAEAEANLKREEEAKDRLCQELNVVVQESANAQLHKLEQLTSRLEHLHVGIDPQNVPCAMASTPKPGPGAPAGAVPPGPQPSAPSASAHVHPSAGSAPQAAGASSATPPAQGQQPQAGPSNQSAADHNGSSPKSAESTAPGKGDSGASEKGKASSRAPAKSDPADVAMASQARGRHVSLAPKGLRKQQPRPDSARATSRAPAQDLQPTPNMPFSGFDT